MLLHLLESFDNSVRQLSESNVSPAHDPCVTVVAMNGVVDVAKITKCGDKQSTLKYNEQHANGNKQLFTKLPNS